MALAVSLLPRNGDEEGNGKGDGPARLDPFWGMLVVAAVALAPSLTAGRGRRHRAARPLGGAEFGIGLREHVGASRSAVKRTSREGMLDGDLEYELAQYPDNVRKFLLKQEMETKRPKPPPPPRVPMPPAQRATNDGRWNADVAVLNGTQVLDWAPCRVVKFHYDFGTCDIEADGGYMARNLSMKFVVRRDIEVKMSLSRTQKSLRRIHMVSDWCYQGRESGAD